MNRTSPPMPPRPARRASRAGAGFTLVELMIVLTIISIVAAFAVPAYGDYVERTRISGALAKLREMHQRMDQYYANNRTFDDGTGRCAIPNHRDDETDFQMNCWVQGGGQRLLVVARGQGTMAGFRYTIDDSGLEQTTSVPAGWSSVALPVNRFLTRKE